MIPARRKRIKLILDYDEDVRDSVALAELLTMRGVKEYATGKFWVTQAYDFHSVKVMGLSLRPKDLREYIASEVE